MLYRYMGQYEKALPLYEKALTIRLYLFGSRPGSMHVDIAQSYNSIGNDFGNDEFFFAILVFVIFFDFEYSWIGCLYLDMCQFKQAEDYLCLAIEQREKLLGVNHQDVAMSLTNLGIIILIWEMFWFIIIILCQTLHSFFLIARRTLRFAVSL
jgi:tetratricopeptide (TPR) repeat protein